MPWYARCISMQCTIAALLPLEKKIIKKTEKVNGESPKGTNPEGVIPKGERRNVGVRHIWWWNGDSLFLKRRRHAGEAHDPRKWEWAHEGP